jgi:hypothetical protein
MAKSTFTYAAAVRNMDRIAAMLVDEEMIWTEVAEKLHLHKQTASRYLWHMARLEQRRIYVCKWADDPATARKIPVFTAGDKPNKRKPKRLTPHQVYKRLQADTARYEARKKKYRATWHSKKGQPIPLHPSSTPFGALFMLQGVRQ